MHIMQQFYPEIFYILPCLALLSCIVLWRLNGRDPSGRGTSATEYEPPLNLSPAEMGLLYDFQATDREITATLVDLAIRGYLQIRRLPKKHIFSTHVSYEFELLNEDVLDLKSHEKALLDGLFGVARVKLNAKLQSNLSATARQKATSQYPASSKSFVGKTVALDQLGSYFYKYTEEAKLQLYSELTARGFFKTHPLFAGMWITLIGVVLLVPSFFLRGLPLVSFLLTGAIFITFGTFMQTRSKTGRLAYETVKGFVRYLKIVEKERLGVVQTAQNAPDAGDRIELYEKYLPYAIALGMEASWNKEFKNVYAQPNQWLNASPAERLAELIESVKACYDNR